MTASLRPHCRATALSDAGVRKSLRSSAREALRCRPGTHGVAPMSRTTASRGPAKAGRLRVNHLVTDGVRVALEREASTATSTASTR
jgi:hypothetical protein